MSSSGTGTLKRRRAPADEEAGSGGPQTASKRRKASDLFSQTPSVSDINGNKIRSSRRISGKQDPLTSARDIRALPTEESPVNRTTPRTRTPSKRTPLTKRLAEAISTEKQQRLQDTEVIQDAETVPRDGRRGFINGSAGNGADDAEDTEDSQAPMGLRSGGKGNRAVWTNHGVQQSPPQKEPVIKVQKRKKKPPEGSGNGDEQPSKQQGRIPTISSTSKRSQPRKDPKDEQLNPLSTAPISTLPSPLLPKETIRKARDSKVPSSVDSMEDELRPIESKAEKKRREERRKKMQTMWVDDSDEDEDVIVPVPVARPRPTIAQPNKLQATSLIKPSVPLVKPTKPLAITPRPALKPAKTLAIAPRPVINLSSVQKLDLKDLTPAQTVKTIAIQKLANRRPIPLTNLDEEYAKVHQLLYATVSAGESNSMLLIGARGSAKTTLVDAAIAAIERDEAAGGADAFHVVRLNGFLHTDDKIASRDIWRQLGRELEDGDGGEENNEGPAKSYADTLTMLLALLSRPEGEEAASAPERISKSVIFIMDEFDLFASHPRQTLLYNLLDIAQSRKAPIAVLGLTTRIDVVESLEKRVKSRFSHRYVHIGLSRSINAFQDVIKAALQVQSHELTFEETTHISGHEEAGMDIDHNSRDSNVLHAWNEAVEVSYARLRTNPNLVSRLMRAQDLVQDKTFLTKYIAPVYHTTKSVPSVMISLLIPLSKASSVKDLIEVSQPSTGTLKTASRILSLFPHPATYLLPPPSHLHVLASLSDLALSLLISACRLDILYSTPLTNFSLTYAEYIEIASKARLQTSSLSTLTSGVSGTRVWSHDVASAEWEKLLSHGLLVPAVGAGESVGPTASKGGDAQMVKVDITLEEVEMALRGSGLLNATMEKWCKQL